jgi:hypothetical protein
MKRRFELTGHLDELLEEAQFPPFFRRRCRKAV